MTTQRRVVKWIKGMAVLIGGMLLASCYETKQEFTLNPDGSGKVKHECLFQNVSLNNEPDTSEEALQSAVAKVIKSCKGVDVWRDVSFKRTADGKIWFQGTAYFKDIAELNISNQGMFSYVWKNMGGGKGELNLSIGKKDDKVSDAKPAPLNAAEKQEKIKAERAKFQQSKPMLVGILGGMKQTVRFHLPGKTAASTNFKKSSNGALDIVFEGKKMIDALEKLTADDTWLLENGFDTKEPPVLNNKLGLLLFGESAPVRAEVAGANAPLFDYAAEVAAAMKEVPKLEKQLGTVTVAPPAKGAALKSLKVMGVRMVSEVDKKLELNPLNQNDAGYTLAVLAELPGSVLNVTDKSAVAKAVTMEGVSLLKEREWDLRLSFPKLSKDQASVLFDIELKRPPADCTGIKEVSGTLQYRVAEGVREVDLGFASLKQGSKGKELGAVIGTIKDGWGKDGSQDLEIKMKAAPEDLKAAYLVVNGARTPLNRNGSSSFGDGPTTFTFNVKSAIPANANVVVELYDQVRAYDVPFKLENLNLLGEPIRAGK